MPKMVYFPLPSQYLVLPLYQSPILFFFLGSGVILCMCTSRCTAYIDPDRTIVKSGSPSRNATCKTRSSSPHTMPRTLYELPCTMGNVPATCRNMLKTSETASKSRVAAVGLPFWETTAKISCHTYGLALPLRLFFQTVQD